MFIIYSYLFVIYLFFIFFLIIWKEIHYNTSVRYNCMSNPIIRYTHANAKSEIVTKF